MEIVVASRNLHKFREYREMFKAFPFIDLLSLLDFPDYEPLAATGAHFKDKALSKAEHAAKHLGRWAIGDDSGIVIPVLNGQNEETLRFFCGDDVSDASSRKNVLKALEGKVDLQRSAYSECAIALCQPEGMKKCVNAICEGVITEEERGRHGFGYDAIFRKHDYDKTFAELDESLKIRISDRRKAFEKLSLFLETLQPCTTM